MVDASLAAAWILHETEAVPEAELVGVLANNEILVPAHWSTEIANAVRRAVRSGRLARSEVPRVMRRLAVLDVSIASPAEVSELLPLIEFSLNHGLSAYDAAYLRLAEQRRVPLGTLDGPLRDAAQRVNVQLLPA